MANNSEKKKMGTVKKVLLILGIAILLLIIVVAALGFGLLNRLGRNPSTQFGDEEPEATMTPAIATSPEAKPGAPLLPTPTPEPTPEPLLPLNELYEQTRLTQEQYDLIAAHNADKSNYINILLIGVDRRGSSGKSQADTMMIATVDKKNGRLKLTSILRDLLVEIPGYGEYRINSAAAKGGIDLLMETIEHNLMIELDRYVLVDFRMFEKVVDRLGGVTVRMSDEEISAANDCIAGLNKQWGVDYLWDGFIFAEGGNVRLTGKQALGYARIRKIDSDFTRTERQTKLLTAIFAKFKSLPLDKQYSLLYDLLPMVETNLQNLEVIDVAISALSMDTSGILHSRIPADETYKSAKHNGSSILLADLRQNAWLAHEFIFESSEEPSEAKVLKPGASLPPRTPSPTAEPAATPDPSGDTGFGFGGNNGFGDSFSAATPDANFGFGG